MFAVSGALAAGRLRMDPIGFLLLGTVTAIGGGTLRDLILGRPVFWTLDSSQLVIALAASLLTYFFVGKDITRDKWMAWSDALGLAAFAVQGTFIALEKEVSIVVAVVMGMMTAVGGGILRDVLSGQRPMIFRGQLYASTTMLGALVVVLLTRLEVVESFTAIMGFIVVVLTRGAAMVFDIRMGPPGSFLTIEHSASDVESKNDD